MRPVVLSRADYDAVTMALARAAGSLSVVGHRNTYAAAVAVECDAATKTLQRALRVSLGLPAEPEPAPEPTFTLDDFLTHAVNDCIEGSAS